VIELSVDVTSPELQRVLQRIQRGMRSLRPVMDSIGQELESRVSARFETETDPFGRAWEPWSPFTAATYPADGHGRILDRYGDMLRSLSHKADADSVRVGFGAVASKAGDVYAIYHEFGTEFMPRRGLLTANPERGELAQGDEAAVLDILGDFLNGLTA